MLMLVGGLCFSFSGGQIAVGGRRVGRGQKNWRLKKGGSHD